MPVGRGFVGSSRPACMYLAHALVSRQKRQDHPYLPFFLSLLIKSQKIQEGQEKPRPTGLLCILGVSERQEGGLQGVQTRRCYSGMAEPGVLWRGGEAW